ncbi:MAG: VWA domain-containing protein, partial [Pseudomonadota bacterium]
MPFVIILPVLLLSAAAAFEFANAHFTRASMQNAADAAALAAASHIDLDPNVDLDAARRDRAERIFASNMPTSRTVSDLQMLYSNDAARHQVVATARHGSFFGGFGDAFDWDISVVAAAQSRATPVELAFVLDTTASMQVTGSWPAARDRFIRAIDQIDAIFQGGDGIRVSFVPFSDRVNVGLSSRNWLTGPAPSDWRGCLRPREEPEALFPHAVTDTPPNLLRFEPSARDTELRHRRGFGRRVTCPMQLTAPTSDLESIRASLRALSPDGTGRFDVGLAWGWRVLSERWRGRWGEPDYPQPSSETRKIALFIGDGYTAVNNRPTDLGLGEHDGEERALNRMSATHQRHFVEVCRKMREDGIELFMLAPQDTYAKMEDAMIDCAVDGSWF